MKIRRGFISNSSSTSFLVNFPNIPNTVEELRELLVQDTLDDYEFEEAVREIWNQIEQHISEYGSFNEYNASLKLEVLSSLIDPGNTESVITNFTDGIKTYRNRNNLANEEMLNVSIKDILNFTLEDMNITNNSIRSEEL
jgi:hypothetical protein